MGHPNLGIPRFIFQTFDQRATMTLTQTAPKPSATFAQEQDFAARQFRGRRETQEDYYAFADASTATEPALSRLLLTVGDGLGAHSGGSVASYIAVNAFVRAFHENEIAPAWRLRLALDAANDTLGFLSQKLPTISTPMGTTLVSAFITHQELYWISVGDSPLFLYRNGVLDRLNEDHSLTPLIEQRVRIGEISQQEAFHHPDRHTLQSALLGQDIHLIDCPPEPLKLKSGDLVIAASDGIFTLDHGQLEEMLSFGRHTTADKIADAILFAVRRLDFERQDNLTVGVVKIP
jgi:serine/threonine protein phosphatase PrpC